MNQDLQRVRASVFGALIGDAAGATLEFLGRKPTEAEVDAALTLPGGGYWKLNPGQITDDGELMISLARALVRSQQQFSIAEIANGYSGWFCSEPFDLGQTISAAFQIGADTKKICGFEMAERMKKQAHAQSFESKANGSLMRCLPLAIWGYKLTDSELARIAALDSELSHPNEACKAAVACYLIALASLFRGASKEEAFERAYNWVLKRESEPTTWLEKARKGELHPAYPQAGFVRIAFQQAFFHLIHGTDYLSAIRATLLAGGDTDTNACIVGGLIGAAGGSVPQDLAEKVINAKLSGLRSRPRRFTPHDIAELVDQLLEFAPNQLEIAQRPSIITKIRRVFGL